MAKTRTEVTPADIDKSFKICKEKLVSRLNKKGWDGFIGPHESAGIIQEEVFEMWDEVRNNNKVAFREELIDIVVAGMFAIASLDAQT